MAEGGVVAREAVDDAGAVGVGLQASEAPQAGVAERAVVEVHRVLGGEDHAHTEGARLLHQRHERAGAPRLERRRGEQAVQRGGERAPLGAREVGIERQGADPIDRRVGEIFEEGRDVGGLARLKPSFGEHRQEHVLAAARRIRIAPEEPRLRSTPA